VASEGGLRALVRRHPEVSFVAVALAWSWGVWVPMAVAGSGSQLAGLVGPLVSAAMISAVEGPEALRSLVRRMTRWSGGPIRQLPMVLAPWLMLAAAIPIAALIDGGWPDLGGMGRIDGWPDLGPVGLFLLLVLLVGFGEETGWRGFLLEHLLRGRSRFEATLIVWAVWALWHVPLFFFAPNFVEMSAATIVGWTIGLGAGAAVLTYVYEQTGRSVLAVALWHASFDMASASEASEGVIAAVVTTAVMFWAVPLWRRWAVEAWRGRGGRTGGER
jgi:membrane protease YdiL (CAAX protease family)